MKRALIAIGIGMLIVSGCKSSEESGSTGPTLINPKPGDDGTVVNPSMTPTGDQIIATVRGHSVIVTRAQLDRPLVEAYGLKMLIRMVTLDLAKEQGRNAGIQVSDADVAAERGRIMETLRKEAREQGNPNGLPATEPTTQSDEPTTQEYEDLLQRVLAQQGMTQPEFAIVLQTNAWLRKIAEMQAAPILAKITDDDVRTQFNARYGEKIRCRMIACRTLKEVEIVNLLLKRGDDFATVARVKSIDRSTAPLGGELFPFTRQDPRVPDTLKQVAFGLQVGQVSDPIQLDEAFVIVKLEERIAPVIVKFEDYKDGIRQEMNEEAIRRLIKQFNEQLGLIARQSLILKDPVLAKQYQAILSGEASAISKEEWARRVERERAKATTQPGGANGESTLPADQTAPPATMPALPLSASPATQPR